MKISFLTVVIAAALFFLTSYSLYTQVMLISILNDVQYLQNDAFYFKKGLNGHIHSSSDAPHLIKKSTPCKTSHSPSTRGAFLLLPLNATWKTLISDISRGLFGILLTTQRVVAY